MFNTYTNSVSEWKNIKMLSAGHLVFIQNRTIINRTHCSHLEIAIFMFESVHVFTFGKSVTLVCNARSVRKPFLPCSMK